MENESARQLHLKSTVQELLLYDFQVECSHPGKEVAKSFQDNPLLPGVILTEQDEFVGMISRRRFLEQMSRPYGLELFLTRPLYSLYRFVNNEVLRFSGETLIVEAARRSLQRPMEVLYEPILVELEVRCYRLLDTHQLLVAQSHIHELATELLSQANHQLEHLASSDSLTGVANRHRFNQYLDACWKQHLSGNSVLSLIMCDVDFFKLYNDTYGHQAGDKCLQNIASAIQGTLKRSNDLVARYGGEEFVVVLPFTPTTGAVYVAELIRQGVRALAIPHSSSPVSYCVTISLGVASIQPTLNESPSKLIGAADTALYQAKSSGRDRVILHPILNQLQFHT